MSRQTEIIVFLAFCCVMMTFTIVMGRYGSRILDWSAERKARKKKRGKHG